MFGVYKKKTKRKTVVELNTNTLFAHAEQLYQLFFTDISTSISEQENDLKKWERENNRIKIRSTKQLLKYYREKAQRVTSIRKSVMQLLTSTAYSSPAKRHEIVKTWFVYMGIFLYWRANIKVRDITTPEGLDDFCTLRETALAKDKALWRIARSLQGKLRHAGCVTV